MLLLSICHTNVYFEIQQAILMLCQCHYAMIPLTYKLACLDNTITYVHTQTVVISQRLSAFKFLN